MTTASFDTLRFARSLREKAKLSPEQAEGISRAFAEASSDQLTTKADLRELGADLRADLARFGAEFRADAAQIRTEQRAGELRLEAKIEANKAEVLKWIFGQTLLIIGALMALLGFGH